MSRTYSYQFSDVGKIHIYQHAGIWYLRIDIPNRIVIIADKYFPTKRAAKKRGMKVLFDHYDSECKNKKTKL